MHILLGQFYSSQPTPAYEKIAAGLRQLGHTVWLGTPSEAGDMLWHDGQTIVARQAAAGPARLAGMSVPEAIARRAETLIRFRRTRRFIREAKPDIVQINVANLLRWLPVFMPKSTHFILDIRQTNDIHGTGLFGRARSWLLNKSRILYSRFVFDRTCFLHWAGARHVLGSNWQRWASVVPMGVDSVFSTAKPPQPSLGDHGVKKTRFVYVGRLVHRRRLERLLDAAAIVRDQTQDFELVFVGYDATDGYYQTYARKLTLEDATIFLPPVPYEIVPEVVLRYDVALAYVPELPVDWQYHPTLKVLEYRALGMPIIATDFLPNRELVDHGVNGLLVENTPASIAGAMLRFILEPTFLADCRNHARANRGGITWQQVARQYESVYRELQSGRDRRQRVAIGSSSN